MIKNKKFINIMEVCGTHTMAIARYGIKSILPKNIRLLSGPGCPICVTPTEDIDRAIILSRLNNILIATFGDMLRIPGSFSSLEKEKANGNNIKIVYSPMDALAIAEENPKKNIVFLGVGFETTSPAAASTVISANKRGIKNFFVLPMFKLVAPALKTILNMEPHIDLRSSETLPTFVGAESRHNNPDTRKKGFQNCGIKKRKIDGFILPGHVSAIIGSKPYEFIAKRFHIPGVISGFEPDDILESIQMILKQLKDRSPKIEIEYSRAVTPQGNQAAQKLIERVFKTVNSSWRSIGEIPKSGLAFNPKYESFDALKMFPVKIPASKKPRGCICGEILLGLKTPNDCKIFAKGCTPQNPVGPCMVSSEGTCAALYKYGDKNRT